MGSSSARAKLSRREFVSHVSVGAAAALMLPASLRASSAPEKKLGVALVGLGGYSSGQLAPALGLTKHCRLAGVVTGSREKGLDWARRHGFSEKAVYGYDTMARMADNPDIDIVYVVTPNALHAEHTIAAAKAGKHVICEKPMAVSVAECDAMIAACRKAGVKLSIGYRLHFDPYHQEVMRLAQAQELGAFKTMDGAFSFVMSRRQWRATKSLAGGGPLMDLGVYVMQEACMAAGGPTKGGGPFVAPVAVTAHEVKKSRPEFFVDVEETIEWTMEFAGGFRATCRTSYNENLNRARIEAEHGWIELGPAYSYNGLRVRTSARNLSFNPPVNQQALQMDDFALCVREGRESRVAGEMGRRDLAIIEAIYASAREGGKRTDVKA